MWDIPSELFCEILSRLPAEPLLRLRCVSKAWRDAIDDPAFVRLHLHRQLLRIQDSSNDGGRLVLKGDLDDRLYSLSLEFLHCDCSESVKTRPLNHKPSYRGSKSPVGSCNGVMLTSDSRGYNFLWNPLTGEFHRLPPVQMMSEESIGLYVSVSGMGYDCASDDFKVVKVAQAYDPRERILKSETFVYSLKLDSWRRIKDFPQRISRLNGGVFLGGTLHWMSSATPLKCMDDLIIGLDLGTEDYCVLPLPSEVSGSEKPSAKHLSVLDGCLVLSCYYQKERLDVWLMKDYGVSNSWIKLFSVGAQDNIGAVETLRPLAFSDCKRQVLLQHEKKEFLWFNLDTKVGKTIRICNGPATFSSQFCLASLVRLNSNHAKDHQEKMNKAN